MNARSREGACISRQTCTSRHNTGNYSSSIEPLEDALRLYLQEYKFCQSDCEGVSHFSSDTDFYALIADVYINTLKCKLKCEANLRPNVGGYFVENFVATVYHHLQYAYYKLNDGHRAVACAYSCSLFEPEDRVMKQNLLYYKAYSQQWGLQPDHFTPRLEALKHYNHTVTLKQMWKLTEMDLKLDIENFLGPDKAIFVLGVQRCVGDHEEPIYASWTQMKGKGDAGESDI